MQKRHIFSLIISTIVLVSLFVTNVGLLQAAIERTPVALKSMINIDTLLGSFTANYQAKDIEKLVNLYAATVKIGDRVNSRQEVKQQYIQLFGKQKDLNIRGIIIIGGKDGFKPVDSNKATGTLSLRVTISKGGQTQSLDTNLKWTIAKPEGGGEWQIIETSKLMVCDDAPAEGH
jgi:ketosteroid isomerase-like protein